MKIAVSANNWVRHSDFQTWLRECESLGFQYVELTDSAINEKGIEAFKGLRIKPISMHLNKTKNFNLDSYEEMREFEKYVDRYIGIAAALGMKTVSISMPSFNSNRRRAESNLKISLLKPRSIKLLLEMHCDSPTQILGTVSEMQAFIESTKSALGVQVETSFVFSQGVGPDKFLERNAKNVKSFHASDFVAKLGRGGFIIGVGDIRWDRLIAAIKAAEKLNKQEYPFIIDMDRNYTHCESYMSKSAIEELAA